jgi:hypothetical protein
LADQTSYLQSIRQRQRRTFQALANLRRKLERMARDWERKDDHERRQRAEAIGRLIEAERAVVDAENELRQLQLQVIAMFLPTPNLLS